MLMGCTAAEQACTPQQGTPRHAQGTPSHDHMHLGKPKIANLEQGLVPIAAVVIEQQVFKLQVSIGHTLRRVVGCWAHGAGVCSRQKDHALQGLQEPAIQDISHRGFCAPAIPPPPQQQQRTRRWQ